MAYDNMQELERLTRLYLEAESTLEEESRLGELLAALPDSSLSEEQLSVKTMLGCFGRMARESSAIRDEELLPETKTASRRLPLWQQIASVAAVVVLGVFIGSTLALRQGGASADRVQTTLNSAPATSGQVYGYINGQPVTDLDEALRQSEGALHSMGVQMNKSASYLSSFDSPMERVSAALTNMK